MDSHLIAVEVCIESCGNERMKLDLRAFDQDRFKCLDAQTVQCRRTVQQDGSFSDDAFQRFPNFRTVALDQTTGALHVGGIVILYKACDHERTIELKRHAL